MDHKHYASTPIEVVEIKAVPGAAGQFTAYASTFGNRDHGGDVIEKGAFRSSITKRKFRPLLWQHDMREPIGIEKSLKEDGKGLLGTWELVDTQRGRDAYALLKAGAVRSMSIGYIPTKWEFEQSSEDIEMTRILKEIDLLENSVVSIPMNDQAQVQSVKHGVHCAMCAALEQTEEAKGTDLANLSIGEHAKLLTGVADAFGERVLALTEKLQAGNFELTEAKRNDLHAILATFASLDAVRSGAEALVVEKPAEEEPEEKASETPTLSALSLALELHRAKARRQGVEV